MNSTKTLRVISAAAVALFVASFLALLVTTHINSSLQKRLDNEKLKSEALLSEKLLKEKALEKKRKQIDLLEAKKTELDDLLKMRTKTVTTQTSENIKIKKALEYASKLQEQGNRLNKELKKELTNEKDATSFLENKNGQLKDSLQLLSIQVSYLKHEMNKAFLRSIDETLISAVKKKGNRVTSKARSVKKLVALVDVPGILQNMNFKIEDPSGDQLTADLGSITSHVVEGPETLTASLNNATTLQNQGTKKIEIVYTPNNKLIPGTYTLKIFNDTFYVGSMKIRLN